MYTAFENVRNFARKQRSQAIILTKYVQKPAAKEKEAMNSAWQKFMRCLFESSKFP